MIKNERQYKIARSKADGLRVSISGLRHASLPDGLSPDMRQLQVEALAGTLVGFEVELAERIGLAEQSIQRYEASEYLAVSFSRFVEIAEALDLTIHYDVRLVDVS